ncbi:hypothetical protein FQN60_006939 [Etheostoma spectabile]|uniref:Uncharacterized protein n=1 Tax=Etheostoma spectabile TaxID=54343 RepID=A0A5J5CH63_9PERO|nr:hypothetical protein FQN60_006939 [Etheostoma spectabile]
MLTKAFGVISWHLSIHVPPHNSILPRPQPGHANLRYTHYFTSVHRRVYFSFRRDPYDYPTHSRPVPREPAPFSGHYHDPPASSQPGHVQPPQTGPQSHQAPSNPRYYPSSPQAGQQQHRAALRQDIPPSPTSGRRVRHTHEAVGGRGDGYRQHSPGRYTSPERYGDGRQPDPRRKNPLIDAVLLNCQSKAVLGGEKVEMELYFSPPFPKKKKKRELV